MKPSEVKASIQAAFQHADLAVPFFLWGAPGVGKSSVVRQITQENQVGFIDTRLLLLDPSDLRGIPVPYKGMAKWLHPDFFPKSGVGIWFFDEMNVAPPLTQGVALQLFLDGRIGEYVKPPGWMLIAAGNREREAFVHRMSPPLLNRFVHLEFDVDNNDWNKWAVTHGIRPEVIAFINFKPDLLMKFDPSKQERAFATPRSWEFVSKLVSAMPNGLLDETIQGAVGVGAAIEFMTYIRVFKDLPSIDDILAGKDIIPERMDVLLAVISSLVSRADEATFNRCLRYSMKLPEEMAVLFGKLLLAKDEKGLVSCNSWADWTQRFSEVVL